MKKLSLCFLLILSKAIFAQVPVNAYTVLDEMRAFKEAGRLDSADVDVLFFTNRFNQLKTPKTLYFVRDTIKFSKGVFAVGNIILDPFLEFNQLLFGSWQWFYSNGVLMAKGDYRLIAYVSCSAGGPLVRAYNMPTGQWYLFHSNAKPLIFGDFEFEKYEIKTSCGLDTFVKSKFVEKSYCLDEEGNVVRSDKQLSVILSLIQEFR